jgi:uncharacterized damage-inducible protein DinB
MARVAIPVEEFSQEMATTRRLLERVPSDKGQWRPHPKSFPLGHLAQLVARMPGWITATLRHSTLDLASGSGYTFEATEALLAVFDQNVKEAEAALRAVVNDALDEPWSLTHGDRVLLTLSKGDITRQTLNHLIHHRGQLTVYLRLLDVPIPSIYGPTADEPW